MRIAILVSVVSSAHQKRIFDVYRHAAAGQDADAIALIGYLNLLFAPDEPVVVDLARRDRVQYPNAETQWLPA